MYINKSEGVMDMFSAFSDAIKKIPERKKEGEYFFCHQNFQKKISDEVLGSEIEMEKFNRGLADARKLLIPKE